MANDRLYIGNIETKEFVYVEKGWGCGWDGSRFDGELIQAFLEGQTNDGHGNAPTNLVMFSECSDCYNDFLDNGLMFVRSGNGFKYIKFSERGISSGRNL
ncbi:MAG: hypothetical protein IPK73_30655 [Candidatus Obscuribacter sp.]|nr:hypothetical protein [Candidatus Obscuribacter sp.]